MSKPSYERAAHALAFYAQKMGISIYIAQRVTRGRWSPNDYTFAVDLRMNDRPLWSGPFTMGSGHAKDGQPPTPTVADVLPSLFLDASCWENADDLLEFCAELGYAIETQAERKLAQDAYASCRKAARYLRADFTDQEYATLEQLSSMI